MQYAVIYEDSIYIPGEPGDERSRTNPGHGYPASPGYSKPIETFKSFENLEGLKTWIKLNEKCSMRPKKFMAIQFEQLKVSTEVVVDVG